MAQDGGLGMTRLPARIGLTRYEADEHYRMALRAYDKRDLTEAILQMDRAITLLPNFAEYWAARGFFRLEDGDAERAAADFTSALGLNEFEVLGNYGAGVLAYREKRWPEAQEAFTKAWAAKPERPDSTYYLALVYHHRGDNTNAMAWMTQAEQLYTIANDKTQVRNAQKWLKEMSKNI
jgi:tetratricopeptide (TPR) repeat protein